jgi:hypothetical protein
MAFKKRNLFKPNETLKLSRSGVELFMNCQKCFYLERKLNVKALSGFPFNLNSAVDELLKNEFDGYREKKQPHPYMSEINKNLIPFQHEDLDKWRANFTGVQFHHKPTDLLLTGAIDDVWVDLDTEELVVVDYKSTSSKEEVNLDKEWQISYKRQMEFYQWLLRKNNFKVSKDGYFVYCNGIKDKDAFNEVLEFDVKILHYQGDDSWVEPTLNQIKNLIESDKIPKSSDECDTCSYVDTRKEIESS